MSHNVATCGECGRRELATYRCSACPYAFDVPGAYHYHAQGHGHWHDPDDRARFHRLIREHLASHAPDEAVFMP